MGYKMSWEQQESVDATMLLTSEPLPLLLLNLWSLDTKTGLGLLTELKPLTLDGTWFLLSLDSLIVNLGCTLCLDWQASSLGMP